MKRELLLFLFALFFVACSSNTKPERACNPNPSDSAVGVIDSVIRWSASDIDGDDLTYDVSVYYFEQNNKIKMLTFEYKHDADSLIIHNIRSFTKYAWAIVVRDGKSKTYGPLWTFRTGQIQK